MTELTRKQRAAIRALLTCSTLREAASVAGVGERSINRWLRLPHFRAELRNEQDLLTAHIAAALAGQAADALDTLVRLHKDKSTPAGVRRAAARDVVAERRKAAELDDLTARIEKIEEVLSNVEKQSAAG